MFRSTSSSRRLRPEKAETSMYRCVRLCTPADSMTASSRPVSASSSRIQSVSFPSGSFIAVPPWVSKSSFAHHSGNRNAGDNARPTAVSPFLASEFRVASLNKAGTGATENASPSICHRDSESGAVRSNNGTGGNRRAGGNHGVPASAPKRSAE